MLTGETSLASLVLEQRPDRLRILEISNYPPPHCGWSMRTVYLAEALRAAGADCQVLNIGPSRRERRRDCIDVQGAADYVWKLVRFALRRYRFHVHVNGDSPKGFILCTTALLVALAAGKRGILTFHAGVSQRFFPRQTPLWRMFFRLLFTLPRSIVCNSEPVRDAILRYEIPRRKTHVIPAFSVQYMRRAENSKTLPEHLERFISSHAPILLCYGYYRPEFALPQLLRAIASLRKRWTGLGVVLIGHLEGCEPVAQYAEQLGIRRSVLFAGDLPHDQFLAALRAADLYVRTHLRDGVSASVLESLAVGTPVLASENETRPSEARTFDGMDQQDLTAKLAAMLENPPVISTTERPVADTLQAELQLLLGAR